METKEFEDLAQSNKSKQQRFSYDHQKPFTPLESRDPSFLNDRLTKLSSDHNTSMLPVEFINREKFKRAVRDKTSRSSSSKQPSSGIQEKTTPVLGKR